MIVLIKIAFNFLPVFLFFLKSHNKFNFCAKKTNSLFKNVKFYHAYTLLISDVHAW